VRCDAAASGGGGKTAGGARLSPVKGVRVGRAETWWWLRPSSSAPAQGRRVRGGKGDVATVNRREKRQMEELTRYGPSLAVRAGGGTPPAVGRRGSGGCQLGGQGAIASFGRGCCGEGGLGGRSERPVHAAVLGGQGCGNGKHEEENAKGKPSALSSQRL
jgi:hypothetical protein